MKNALSCDQITVRYAQFPSLKAMRTPLAGRSRLHYQRVRYYPLGIPGGSEAELPDPYAHLAQFMAGGELAN